MKKCTSLILEVNVVQMRQKPFYKKYSENWSYSLNKKLNLDVVDSHSMCMCGGIKWNLGSGNCRRNDSDIGLS